MSEVVTRKPPFEKGSDERNAVAQQLRALRVLERRFVFNGFPTLDYVAGRRPADYLESLDGLRHFFDYTRAAGDVRTVLDVGAGFSAGVSGLAKSNIGKGLDFRATGLVRSERVDHYIGNENFHTTSAEVLRGIPDNSIAGILALNSVAYSASPAMVVGRFNEVLIPGGAIKGLFRSRNLTTNETYYNLTQFKTPDPFIAILKGLGFDVADSDDGVASVLLAIKPGGILQIKAQDLLDLDRIDHRTHLVRKIFLRLKEMF